MMNMISTTNMIVSCYLQLNYNVEIISSGSVFLHYISSSVFSLPIVSICIK